MKNPPFKYILISIASVALTTIPAFTYACGNISLTASPQYFRSDADKTTVSIHATVTNPDGSLADNGSVTFSVQSSPSPSDGFSDNGTVPISDGSASINFYHYSSNAGKIKILAVATITVTAEDGTSITYYPTSYIELSAIKIEIGGPNVIPLFKANTPQVTISAIIDPPGNGRYSWSVVNGRDKIQIISDKTKDKIVIKGLKKSAVKNDVDVKLIYEINSERLEIHRTLTVLKPTVATREKLKFVRYDVMAGKIVLGTGIGCKQFLGTLRDQFGDSMPNVPVTENVSINYLKSKPKRFIPIPATGSAITNSSGNYYDSYVVIILGPALPNTQIFVSQKLTFGGYVGRNNIIINYSSVSDSYPIQLK
ncbi:MAG: hypothetical protein WC369_01440 [Dehalococcoidales bacterium]|jgi:hypothetical protein